MLEGRYASHQGAGGWSSAYQEILGTKVAVVAGSGFRADIAAVCMQGLGFKELHLVRNPSTTEGERSFLGNMRQYDRSSDVGVVKSLRRIDPATRLYCWELDCRSKGDFGMIPYADVLVDASEDPIEKYGLMKLCQSRRVRYVSTGYAKGDMIIASVDYKKSRKKLSRELEGIFMQEVTSGREPLAWRDCLEGALSAEEARKAAVSIDEDDEMIDDIVQVNLGLEELAKIEDCRFFVSGAGSTGTFFSLTLAQMMKDTGSTGGMVICDHDEPEQRNLNRQFFYSQRTGLKSAILAQQLGHLYRKAGIDFDWINGTVAADCDVPLGDVLETMGAAGARAYPLADGITERAVVGEDFFAGNDYDVLVSCVDNDLSRRCLSIVGKDADIPFVTGGTAGMSGYAYLDVRGWNECFDCFNGLSADELIEQVMRRRSCAFDPVPSIVTTNAAIGGIMAGSAFSISAGNPGFGLFGQVRYDSMTEQKICFCKPERCGCSE